MYDLIVFLDHHQRPRAVEQAVEHEPDLLAGGVHLLEEQQPSSAHCRGHQPILEGDRALPGGQESADDVVRGRETMQVHAVYRGSDKRGEVAHELGLAHAGVPVKCKRCVQAIGESAPVEERIVVEIVTQRRHEVRTTGKQGEPATDR